MNRQLEKARCCDASVALQKARLLYGTTPRLNIPIPAPNKAVQLESQLLDAKLVECPPILNKLPTTESKRMNAHLQKIADAETDPTNPTTRFKQYVRFFPTPCPVVGAEYLNASMPKTSTACQLPNAPHYPIFPA